MALTKRSVVDRIEILEDGEVQVRTSVQILEDGEVISRSFKRHVVVPEQDTVNEVQRVKDVTNAVWTPAVISKYKTKAAAKAARRNK